MRVGFLVFALVASACAQAPDGSRLDITVQDVRGEADSRPQAGSPWTPIEKGTALPVGAEVCTGAGASVWLAFGTNSVALVRESTMFRVESFGMEGDSLVARVWLDPGVASVSIVQRQQFLTDFEVSTPRVTASIRGSGETVVSNGDEVADRVFVDEHFAEVVFRSGQVLGVAEGGATNSNREAPYDLAARENLADVTPVGASPQETASAEGAVETSESTDVIASNLTVSPTSNPVAGPDGPLPQSESAPRGRSIFDEIQKSTAEGDNEAQHDLGHFILEVGDIQTHLSRDRELAWRWEQVMFVDVAMTTQIAPPESGQDAPPEWDPKDMEWSEANHPRLHADGVDSFIDDYLLVFLHDDFHRHEADHVAPDDPALAEELHADFHLDRHGEGYDRFVEDLHAAEEAARAGRADREAMGRLLIDAEHMSWHMEGDGGWRAPDAATYEAEHERFHREFVDPLVASLANEPYDRFVAEYTAAMHARWHEETGCPDDPTAEDPRAAAHAHFHELLDRLSDHLAPAPTADDHVAGGTIVPGN